MMEMAGYNPIIAQLKILKDKLSQKNKLIQILTECIQTQQKALFSIVSQFQEHQAKIMRRLHRLEEINLRYIKDYLEIKKQYQMEDFVQINRMFVNDPKTFISKRIASLKAFQKQVKQGSSVLVESKKMADTCLNLMKSYLSQRKINYDKSVAFLSEQRKRKLKSSKGLEEYRQNKQQAKFIDELNKKITTFEKQVCALDNGNTVELFHKRHEIQNSMARLDPSKGQITIEDSQLQQKMFRQIIQQLVTHNDSPEIERLFLEGSFSFIQEKMQALSEAYGLQYINQSIESLDHLSPQQRDNIIKGNIRSHHHITSNDGLLQQTMYNQSERDTHYYTQQGRQVSARQISSKNAIERANYEGRNDGQESGEQADILSTQRVRRAKQERAGNTKLDNKFNKTLAKSFFEQQDKKRDELINQQKSEIVEHSKVIDKLITFIKKEFKDRKLDDIDADDPEQLIGYYFKVNEKKYGDIREEMMEVQARQKEADKISKQLKFQNGELNIKVNELKAQIDQLLKKYEKSSFQLHILISRTEDLVKISLETLINTCMKNITPQQLIIQLERIIELIKENLQKKNSMIYKFTIRSEIIEDNSEKVQEEEYVSLCHDNYSVLTEQLAEVKAIEVQKKVKSEIYDKKVQSIPWNSHELKKDQVKQESFHEDADKIGEPNVASQPRQSSLKVQSNKSFDGDAASKKCEGFDEKYINSIKQQIQIIKDRNLNSQQDELYDMKEMYAKYKQALDSLERAENINRQKEIKYQSFLNKLKTKRAWQCPQKLEEKLFYMENLIAEQNELLQNQREEYEQTILKQVNQSEQLAQRLIKKLKVKRRETQA